MIKCLEKYQSKLQSYYNNNGKLLQYPSKWPMRVMALIKIADGFERGKEYTEKEVNAIIKDYIEFSDIEWIRREMFQYKILGRLIDGSKYWLEDNWKEELEEYLNSKLN